MSHIKLNEEIYHKNKTPYALILEDDILLLKDKNFDYNLEINKIINYYNLTSPKWDIIKLHSFFFGMGSAAAYIVNRKSMEKISKTKLNYHIDIQYNNFLNIIFHDNLFITKDIYTKYKTNIENLFLEDNQKIGFYLHSDALKLLNKSLRYIDIYISIVFLLFLRFFEITKTIAFVGLIIFFIIFLKCALC